MIIQIWREREREWCCLECKEGEGVEVVPCEVFCGWVEQVRKSLLLRFTLIMQVGTAPWKLLMANNILCQFFQNVCIKNSASVYNICADACRAGHTSLLVICVELLGT